MRPIPYSGRANVWPVRQRRKIGPPNADPTLVVLVGSLTMWMRCVGAVRRRVRAANPDLLRGRAGIGFAVPVLIGTVRGLASFVVTLFFSPEPGAKNWLPTWRSSSWRRVRDALAGCRHAGEDRQ
jgi:hypothetical protein